MENFQKMFFSSFFLGPLRYSTNFEHFADEFSRYRKQITGKGWESYHGAEDKQLSKHSDKDSSESVTYLLRFF